MDAYFNPRPACGAYQDPMSSSYDPARCGDENDKVHGYGKYRDNDEFITQSEKTIKAMETTTQLSEYDKSQIAEILHGQGDWFMAKLCRLIANADNQSKKQLYAGFPDAVDAVHKFQTGKSFTDHLWTEGKL